MTDQLQSLTDWLHTTITALEEMEQEEDIVKVTINPNGDVIFDVDNIRDAVAFANQVRNGNGAAELPEEFQARKATWEAAHTQSTEDPILAEAVDLPPSLREVYEHLVDNDYPEGVTASDLAVTFGINLPAMKQRLRKLGKEGLIENIGLGMWRATR